MNKNKIKFKYILNLWKSLPNYPTKEDIVYEVSLYLAKDGRPNGDISHQTFNSIFGSSWEKMKHGEVIKTMIEEGDFKEIEKSTGTKKWYRIKNNPYYNT
jgi:hypothetical protein